MTALADLLIGDSALLLYFSESRTRSRNSTKVPIFQNFLLFMCVLLRKYFYCTAHVPKKNPEKYLKQLGAAEDLQISFY